MLCRERWAGCRIGVHCCRTIPVVDVEHEANRRHPEPGQVEPEDVGVGIVIGMERKTAIDGSIGVSRRIISRPRWMNTSAPARS